VLGGNGSFRDSLYSMPYVIFDLGQESPHSNYLCLGLSCAKSGQQSVLESARDNYFKPYIEIPFSGNLDSISAELIK